MKVIFTGTSEFAVPSIEAVIASHHVLLAVITQPDKPSGRGQGMHISPVKEVALAHNIPILQPEKISVPESLEEIRSLGPIGVMVVVAYGQKIPVELLEWPKKGVVNVHGSILPKYRGAAPIQHSIMAGEKETGVTTMLMDEGWDTGDILLQDTVPIGPSVTAGELADELALLGSKLLVKTLEGLEDGSIGPVPQDNELATLAHSLPRDAGVIDWELPADVIVNRVRGCIPKPGAFAKHSEGILKVWHAVIDQSEGKLGEPGEVIGVGANGVTVAAGAGSVRLIELQPESRKRMSAADYARGAKMNQGARLDVRFELS
jgi:methionyl-tRNA formyltransferase